MDALDTFGELYFDDLPSGIQDKLKRMQYTRQKYNTLSPGEKMAALMRTTRLEVNAVIPVTKDLPYFVLALEEGINAGTITNVPQRAFQNAEEASRYAQSNARRDRPMFVLKVVAKVEIAPPPTVVTSFDE